LASAATDKSLLESDMAVHEREVLEKPDFLELPKVRKTFSLSPLTILQVLQGSWRSMLTPANLEIETLSRT
jgi:hypothetical protein